MSAMAASLGAGIPIKNRITCPHCWSSFPPDQTLWVAQHPDLAGDPRLGSDHPKRFLPSRFNLQGDALDVRGFACHELACPKCHLSVPRAFFEMTPVFVSILGAPASGKSYFLAAMTWRLRRVLPTLFSLGFSDADPVFNHRLEEYESLQFLNPKQDELVVIEKTDVQGDPYDSVLFGDQRVNYPRPFVFSVAPVGGHPNYLGAARAARVLCMYDNAGESFLPGADTAASPVTRHLARSRMLMFLFDPTQDMRFRKLCRGKTSDPQMLERSERLDRERPVRQETILAEAAQRVRHFAGLGQNQRHRRPLVVIVTKFDAWLPLLTDALNGSSDHSESASALADALRTARGLPHPWATSSRSQVAALDLSVVETISRALRSLLWRVSPEIVSVAEGFAGEVVYIPVSATGRSPERDPRSGALGFRPRDVKPVWAEVPLLYSMSRWMQGLVPYRAPAAGNEKPAGSRSPWADHRPPGGPDQPPDGRR